MGGRTLFNNKAIEDVRGEHGTTGTGLTSCSQLGSQLYSFFGVFKSRAPLCGGVGSLLGVVLRALEIFCSVAF